MGKKTQPFAAIGMFADRARLFSEGMLEIAADLYGSRVRTANRDHRLIVKHLDFLSLFVHDEISHRCSAICQNEASTLKPNR